MAKTSEVVATTYMSVLNDRITACKLKLQLHQVAKVLYKMLCDILFHLVVVLGNYSSADFNSL